MAGNPDEIDHSLPGSFILQVLRSPRFQEALNGGILEASQTGDLQKGIEYFNIRSVENGLAVHALFALTLEVAKMIIRWYFDEQRKNKANA